MPARINNVASSIKDIFLNIKRRNLFTIIQLFESTIFVGQKVLNFTVVTLSEIFQQFIADMQRTTWLEYTAVVAGILSVWYSKKENILVYPIGLINTAFYVYISFKGHLLGEATVNLYYTIMNVVGWYLWTRKDAKATPSLQITNASRLEWMLQLSIFAGLYLVIYLALIYFKNNFYEGIIPWADALASASAFTGMWLMTTKKVESWYWWILTNIVSIPLYFVKHYVFTSVYYVILLFLAIAGLVEWRRKAAHQKIDHGRIATM